MGPGGGTITGGGLRESARELPRDRLLVRHPQCDHAADEYAEHHAESGGRSQAVRVFNKFPPAVFLDHISLRR